MKLTMKNKKGASYPIIKLIAYFIAAIVLVLVVVNAGTLSDKMNSLIQRMFEFLRFR